MNEVTEKHKKEGVRNTNVFQTILYVCAGLIVVLSFLLPVLALVEVFLLNPPQQETITNEVGPNCSIQLSKVGENLHYRIPCILQFEGEGTLLFYSDQMARGMNAYLGAVLITGPFLETSGDVPIPMYAIVACLQLQLEDSPNYGECLYLGEWE